jgi:CheY-like chemotaxis protein
MEPIVVVDDDRVFRELLQTILKMEGYRAVMITSPEDVVPTVREEEPVLVLMDVHIHNQDTLGALRDLKGDKALKDIPVVMTSGMDRAEECLDAGADAFVLKPFRPSEMLVKISDLVESREKKG